MTGAPKSPTPEAAVTREDRVLFIFLLGFDVVPKEGGFPRILNGEFDHLEKMQRIARHRIAASTPDAEQSARAMALLRRIAAKESWQSHYGRTWEDEAAEIVSMDAPPPAAVERGEVAREVVENTVTVRGRTLRLDSLSELERLIRGGAKIEAISFSALSRDGGKA